MKMPIAKCQLPNVKTVSPNAHSVIRKSVIGNRHFRHGSILILVIALLVMLALVGTAFISTTRNDRASAAQGVANTQTDLFITSVKNLAINTIVNDTFATGPLHTPDTFQVTPPTTAIYNPVTSPVTSTFLAGRVPIAGPKWEWISAPLSGATFEDPTIVSPSVNTWGAAGTTDRYQVTITSKAGAGGTIYPALQTSTNTYVAGDADGDGIADCGLVRLGALPGPQFEGVTFYYGVRIIDGNSAINATTAWTNWNDGARTAGAPNPGLGTLRNNRLTPASVGLREMLNPNTVTTDFDYPTGGLGGGALTLNQYRYNGVVSNNTTDPGTIAANEPLVDYNSANAATVATIAPVQRGDFAFNSQLDAFWSQLGSRPDYPGYLSVAAGTVPALRFQAPPLTDTAALAYRFCLANPSNSAITSTNNVTLQNAYQSAPSILEQTLHDDLYNFFPSANTPFVVPHTPYAASDFTTWFNNNFTYGTPGTMPLRALLVTRNPVTNFAPRHTPMPASSQEGYQAVPVAQFTSEFMTYSLVDTQTGTETYVDYGAYVPGTSYPRGALVYNNSTSATITDSRPYLSLTVANGTTPPSASWRYQPWTLGSAKVNVNVSAFEDLWRGYWNVMVNDIANSGYSPFDNPNPIDPTTNAQVVVDGTMTYHGNEITGVVSQHPERMFRSVIRGPSINRNDPFLSSQDMVLLRSAIAAANAEHMRDFSQTPTSDTIKAHTIALQSSQNFANPTKIRADVYAAGIQPFITEVYVSQDIETGHNTTIPNAPTPNPDGYIAIELYNPFTVNIDLGNWKMVILDRGSSTAQPWHTTTGTAPFPKVLPAGTIIKARGYLLIENYSQSGGAPAAQHRPNFSQLPVTGALPATRTTATPGIDPLTVVVEPQLSSVLTHEMVLLRPLDGAIAGNVMTSGANGNIAQVPVDSFDFTGFKRGTLLQRNADGTPAAGSLPAQAYEYYYARNAGTGFEWQSVYPGHYNGSSQAGSPHEQLVANNWQPATAQPDPNNANNTIEVDKTDPWDAGITTTDPNSTNISTGGNVGPPLTATFGYNHAGTDASSVNINRTTSKNFTIQLGGAGTVAGSTGFGGPNSPAVGTNHYPFGQFMREADLMQIPFIGSYVIYDSSLAGTPAAGDGQIDTATAALYEANSVSMDSAFADDTDPNDDLEENVGRFCPIVPAYAIPSTGNAQTYISEFAGKPANLRYGWAARLFDYLTVRGMQHSPDASPPTYVTATAATDPQPISHSSATIGSVPSVPGNDPPTIDGLININTAPAEVLRRVPWVWVNSADPTGTDPQNKANADAANKNIAAAIIAYRDGSYGTTPIGVADGMSMTANSHRYFHNLFELNKVLMQVAVPAPKIESFRTNNFYGAGVTTTSWGTESATPEATATFTGTPTFKTHDNGDFSPITAANFPGSPGSNEAATDGVVNDFESQFLQLTAVSNLITTRSDTFTVYIDVEGWTNVGTAQAARVIQHRIAFLVDRTGVTSTNNRVVKITPVPTD